MNLSDLRSKVTLDFLDKPQLQAKAVNAVASLEAAIGELSSLGYRYAVVEEFGSHAAPVPQEFPKMLYRTGEFPREVTVDDEEGEATARKLGYAGLNEPPEAPEPVAPPKLVPPAPAPQPAPSPVSAK